MSFRSLAHLTGALAANSPARPLDVLRIKSALGALGHYDAPEWGVTPFPDGALFAGIEAFQRARGLKVDGRMTPAGETEAALVQVLSKRAGRKGDAVAEGATASPVTGVAGQDFGALRNLKARRPQGVQVSDLSKTLKNAREKIASWFEPSEEEKARRRAWNRYYQQWYPDYEYGANNLGTRYTNPGGVRASKQALEDAFEAEATIGAGQALSIGGDKVKGPVGATMGMGGTFLEEAGEKKKRDFLTRDYRKNRLNKE